MGIKHSFTKGITTLNMKTNNFMEASKSKTYIVSLEKEIRELMLAAGNSAYQFFRDGTLQEEGLMEYMEQIAEKSAEIERQKEKIVQLAEEERQVLGKQTIQPQTAVGGSALAQGNRRFCSQCGAETVEGSRFCGSCGQPLS
jgi:hypothetical protein